MDKTSMKNEYRFWAALVLISVLFISILLFLLLRMVYPAHVEQMKQRARETVSHLHIVIPHLKPDVRQHYLETIQKKNDELSYLLIMDMKGDAIAHSNPGRIKMNFYEAGLKSCLETGNRIEQIYIRDADKPLSPFHGEKTFDIIDPLYSSDGRIAGAVNVGLSLKAVEKIRHNYMTASAAGTFLWIVFVVSFAVVHLRIMKLKKILDLAFRESQNKYRFLLENSRDIPYSIDRNGILTFIGPQIDQYGYDPSVMTGHSILEYINPRHHDEIINNIKESIEQNFSFDSRFSIYDTDGNITWFEEKGNAIIDQKGDVTGFSGILRDITAQWKAQNELSEVKALLAAAIEQSPAGIIIADVPDAKIRICNSEALRIRGADDNEKLDGIPFTFHQEIWRLFYPDHRPVAPDELPLARAIMKGEKTSNFELILKRPGGAERTILINASPVLDENGTIIAGIVLFLDITEKRILEEQLKQSQKMEIIGQLAGGMAHDFNNMLAGIIGSAELLKLKTVSSPELQGYADVILKGSQRAAELTRNLLAFSRKVRPVLDTIDIHDPVDETIAILERTIDKSIEIKKRFEAVRSIVNGDHTLLQNVFINLGVNARDAMPDGGALTYRTYNTVPDINNSELKQFSLKPGNYAVVEVSDTGTGMDEKIMHRIFEPFFTTKRAGQGTGLGLAAVSGTIREHGGAVTVTSRAGKGSVFTVYLPVHDHIERTADETEEGIIRGAGSILIVDDEPLMLEMDLNQLKYLGYEVVAAESGTRAVEIMQSHTYSFSLAIIDLVMPGMSGLETFIELKKIDPGLKILFTSGSMKKDKIDSYILDGLAGFIQKPYKLSRLSVVVSEAMRGHYIK